MVVKPKKKKCSEISKISQNIGTPFNASNGWFVNFKKRFDIRKLKICGEKLYANQESVSTFICSLKLKILLICYYT